MCIAEGQVIKLKCKKTGYVEFGKYAGKSSDCYIIKSDYGDKLYKIDDWEVEPEKEKITQPKHVGCFELG